MTKARKIAIALFRNDLRLHDNVVIHSVHASSTSSSTHVLPLYVWDERHVELSGFPNYQRSGPEARTRVCGFWRTGSLRARFLAECVEDLRQKIRQKGSRMLIRYGKPEVVAENLAKALKENGDEVEGVWMEKEVCTEELAIENRLKKRLEKLGVPVHFVHGKTLIHPDDLPFPYDKVADVFTPYRKRIERINADDSGIRRPLSAPDRFKPFPDPLPDTPDYGSHLDDAPISDIIDYLVAPLHDAYPSHAAAVNSASSPSKNGHPNGKDGSAGGSGSGGGGGREGVNEPQCRSDPRNTFPFPGGETAALARVHDFFHGGHPPSASTYKKTRNQLVGHEYSTKFSPWLCSGSLSPREVIVQLQEHEKRWGANENTYWVRFELLWRDYFMLVTAKYGSKLFTLWGFEEVTDPKNTEEKKGHPWKEWDGAQEGGDIWKWMMGETGVPFIDANMVELRETGFMSNRGRQNVASFLNKDLYVDWRVGAEFFEANLVDFEPCANYGNWQYVAGVGNDPRAARYFNSIKQANDYDPQGRYVKQWRPQLRNVPNDKVHTPWLLSAAEQKEFGIPEGDTYTKEPVVEAKAWKHHYNKKRKSKPKSSQQKPKKDKPENAKANGAGLESDSDASDSDGGGDNSTSGSGSGHSASQHGGSNSKGKPTVTEGRNAFNRSGSDESKSSGSKSANEEKEREKERQQSWWRGGRGVNAGTGGNASRGGRGGGPARGGNGQQARGASTMTAAGENAKRSEASSWRKA